MKNNKIKLHPLLILENVISSLFVAIFIAFVFNSVNLNHLILLIPIYILITTIVSFFNWYYTNIYIDNFFNIETGKLFKKRIKINLKDIATVSTTKNILEKIFKISTIKIELNSGVNQNINQKLLLKDSDALLIKSIISKENKKKSLVEYSKKDILNHLFLSASFYPFIFFIIVLGLTFIFESNLAILLTIITLLFGYIQNLLKNYFQYHNFKLWKEDTKIKLSYGFFSEKTFEIPLDKINAVIISQTIQARVLNKYTINIVNAGIGNEETERTILCLYSSKEKIDELMNIFFSDFDLNGKTIKQTPKALKIYLINKMPLVFLVAMLCLWLPKWLLLIDVIFVFISIIQYDSKKLTLNNQLLISETGFINRKKIIINHDKITKVNFTLTFIGKLYNVKYIKISTIGSLGETIYKLGYYGTKTESKFLNNFK